MTAVRERLERFIVDEILIEFTAAIDPAADDIAAPAFFADLKLRGDGVIHHRLRVKHERNERHDEYGKHDAADNQPTFLEMKVPYRTHMLSVSFLRAASEQSTGEKINETEDRYQKFNAEHRAEHMRTVL